MATLSQLFDVNTFGESYEVTEEIADTLKQAIMDGAKFVTFGKVFLQVSAIMAIVPSKKNHPDFTSYQRYLAQGNKHMPFETYLDRIGHPREAFTALKG